MDSLFLDLKRLRCKLIKLFVNYLQWTISVHIIFDYLNVDCRCRLISTYKYGGQSMIFITFQSSNKSILLHQWTSYGIYGGQTGKTVLLKHAWHTYTWPEQNKYFTWKILEYVWGFTLLFSCFYCQLQNMMIIILAMLFLRKLGKF